MAMYVFNEWVIAVWNSTHGQTGRQTDIHKLLLDVQNPMEGYVTHGCCA